jgi:hypothetical protein
MLRKLLIASFRPCGFFTSLKKEKPLNPPIQGFYKFYGFGLFKILCYLGKFLSLHSFDSF